MTEFGDEHVDTGFADLTESSASAVTVTVSPTDSDSTSTEELAASLTPEGREALKAMVALPKDFGPPQMIALARDLAIDLNTVDAVVRQHGLTNAQFEFLSEHNEFFKNALKSIASEVQGVGNTAERLRIQAQAALEQQLPVLAGRMGKQSEKLAEVVEAFKVVARIAGADSGAPGGAAPGERFTISIDLGADTRLVIGNAGGEEKGPAPGATGALSRDAEGKSKPGPVRQLIEGTRG